MSAPRSHMSSRSHHSRRSHRTRSRDEDVESIASPESIASFSAPTVIPGDSVSQVGSRSYYSRTEARARHGHNSSRHSHHSSHSRSNVDFDDRSSGLLTAENLEAHNAEGHSRASTPRPTDQLYVEVVEDRTATGSYYSYDTPRQSLHPNDGPARSHHSRRSPSPSPRVEALSRAMEDRLSVSRSHASAHPSRSPRSHISKGFERSLPSERPDSSTPSKPPTVISRRNPSHSPPRSSTSRHTSHTRSRSRSHAPTSASTQVSSHASHRTSQRPSLPSLISTPRALESCEVAVYEDIPYIPSRFRDTYTVEVEAAEDQERGRDYKIHHRHEYPVYGDV